MQSLYLFVKPKARQWTPGFRKAFTLLFLLIGLLEMRVMGENTILPYQGRAAVNGMPLTGTGAFKFAIVNQAGTKTYWSNDGSSVDGSEPVNALQLPVEKGLFAVRLGDVNLPGMNALASDLVLRANLMLRVWFNDGTRGWQQLSPDSRYDPPTGMLDLLRRTELLEDNDFIWKVDAFVFHNGGKQPKRNNAFWEAFSDQNGYRDSVSSATPGSIYNGRLRVVRIVMSDARVFSAPFNATGGDDFVASYVIGRRVGNTKFKGTHGGGGLTEKPGRHIFQYEDGTSVSVPVIFHFPTDPRSLISVTNPQPNKIVTSVIIRGNTNVGSPPPAIGGLSVTSFEVVGPDEVSAVLTLPNTAITTSRFRVALESENEIGDVIQYSISNGSTTLSELDPGVTYEWSGNSNPTSLQLHLTPAPAGSWQKTGVSSVAFFYY
jgi:hypothetical protein